MWIKILVHSTAPNPALKSRAEAPLSINPLIHHGLKTGVCLGLISALLLLNLTGCATTKKESAKTQTQLLKEQVSSLEVQLKQRDEEIQGLEKELEKAESAGGSQQTTLAADQGQASSRQIQLALKSAGFYEGPVDGKIGKNTKKAIKAFQEANGLSVDGVVGKKTWSKLKVYIQ